MIITFRINSYKGEHRDAAVAIRLSLKWSSMMINVTLDMNCIIDLEKEKGAATHVRSLMKIHENGKINLRVVAISASEQKHDGTYASNFSEFKNRIAAIGLGRSEILKPLVYLGA